MKSKLKKVAVGFGLLAASAVAFASSMDCCGGLECCLQMLSCCF